MDDIETRITKYFRNKNEIDIIIQKIALLTNQTAELENDIKNTNISLSDGVGGIRYDLDKFDTGYKENAYEKQLVQAITKLEEKVIENKNDIIKLKLELHSMENEILEFERVLVRAGVNEENLMLLKLKYVNNLTYIRVGVEVDKSDTFVRKNILATKKQLEDAFVRI